MGRDPAKSMVAPADRRRAGLLGEANHAISGALLDTLKNKRQKMRKLIATLREQSLGFDPELIGGVRSAFAQTLLALARTLDSHVGRYDDEVLPSILRALFHK
jgi:hypothetical protein